MNKCKNLSLQHIQAEIKLIKIMLKIASIRQQKIIFAANTTTNTKQQDERN